MEAKVRRVGNSLGLTLTKEALELLNVQEGDTLHLVKARGGLLLTRCDPQFARAMQAYKLASREYHDALNELAQ
ncbi:AbrB/MazE/SpoVT family DNA-binding domain-containing protein [Gloeobacter violaceus]|uniref:Gsr2734 protein n=1 Tax=Gloeobacter violaceus (strain ATCC 29082 / PCC 7421) TaxID=251221 RepID=Q7NH03_GLOVI|nr:AbrB/MazE/SpoVT family DNA-binding domain-containing protein [Gloeobacter violaceus]BAC90675.1 gsr2734 [Gloeobacter violaceus PCC 7421]